MQERMRLYATLIIWTAFTAMTTVLFNTNNSRIATYDTIPLLGILAGAAAVGTFSIWISSIGKGAGKSVMMSSASEREALKRKRVDRARLERLLDRMDEDDLLELEDLLLERGDGTQTTRGGYR